MKNEAYINFLTKGFAVYKNFFSAEEVEDLLKTFKEIHGDSTGTHIEGLHNHQKYWSIITNKKILDIAKTLSNDPDIFYLYNSQATLSKKDNNLCYAIIIEPISASTLKNSDDEFLKKVRELCNRENIILIYDEIYSGWCKTGDLFNFFSSGTIPDILVYAKSFGGGKASISGYTVRDSIMDKTYDNPNDFS